MNFSLRKAQNKYISFLEKIVSKEDLIIAAFLNNYFSALNNKNNSELKMFFLPETIIDSYVAGGRVSADKYIEAMMKEKNIHFIFFDNITTSFCADKTVCTFGEITVVSKYGVRSFKNGIKLVKKDDWKIKSIDFIC